MRTVLIPFALHVANVAVLGKAGASTTTSGLKPKLLYFATEDWAFHTHFPPMARATGCEVVLAAPVRSHGDLIASEGERQT